MNRYIHSQKNASFQDLENEGKEENTEQHISFSKNVFHNFKHLNNIS